MAQIFSRRPSIHTILGYTLPRTPRINKITNINTIGAQASAHGSLSFWSTEQPSSGRSGVVRFHHARILHKNTQTLKEKIGAAGLSVIASYGLFNTLYYFFAYLAILFSLPTPSTITSLSTALTHACTLLALVWAGSQVTKVPRAACAMACAPLMDRLLGKIRDVFRLYDKRQAFLYVLVPLCWLLFFLLIGISILSIMVVSS